MTKRSFPPTFQWIEVIATAALAASMVLLLTFWYSHGAQSDDLLALAGGIAGAGLGAWLAVGGAIKVERTKRDELRNGQSGLLIDALEACKVAINKLSSVKADSPGELLIRAHLAHEEVETSLADLSAIKAVLPIDDFALFRTLRKFDGTVRFYKAFIESTLAAGQNTSTQNALHAIETFHDQAEMFEKALNGQIDFILAMLRGTRRPAV